MKNILLLLSVLSSSVIFALEAQDITGFWVMPENAQGRTPIANLFENDNNFYALGFAYTDLGKSTSDSANPNPELRDRLLKDVMIVNGIQIEKGKLVDGEIYNPENGKYYYLKGTLSDDKNTIKWKASIDKAGLFGPTIIWTRVTNPDTYKNLAHTPEELKKLIPSKKQK